MEKERGATSTPSECPAGVAKKDEQVDVSSPKGEGDACTVHVHVTIRYDKGIWNKLNSCVRLC